MVLALDVGQDRLALLARRLEDHQRSYAAIRYGSIFRVGLARVVINPDSPLAASNFAASLNGPPDAADVTLQELPHVWAEHGIAPVILLDSPSSLPELGALAEELDYEAAEELAVMVLAHPQLLVEGEPGRQVVPVGGLGEHAIAAVLADAFDYTEHVEAALPDLIGQRLDDPRVVAVGAHRDGELAGVALAFVEGDVGLIAELGVRSEARGHGIGRAVASAAAAECITRGARLVWLSAEAGGLVERFWQGLGFVEAYDAITYQLRP
ncbi:MAG TPA: GNAT family N-acetyltransferase [Mycobacteriales bacterium]|nr:GNAT family N-acetyltransferase [Mycobacteriales bacterium]